MKKIASLLLSVLPLLVWAQPVQKPAPTLSEIHDRLVMNPQQQALWGDFEGKVDAYTAAYYRQKPVLPSPEDEAPHQISRLVDNLQNRLAALEDVESAAKRLYASLMPEQKKLANELLVSAIPTFTPTAVLASNDAPRKELKPEKGKRSRRGVGGGTSPGPFDADN